MIRRSAEDFFLPEFDEDGNQLYIQTETGDWALNYNAANRPTDFSCMDEEGNFLTVKCDYDFMGRRVFKKVISGNSTVISHQRFIYRGYLQIACVDLTRTNHPCLWLITWDPTQPVATRPLAIQKDGTWYTYGLDLTKNVCEVFGATGYIRTAYTYSPYGSVTATGNVTQPIQWSSEFNDEELGLVYYNYRYYNTAEGRWNNRDYIYSEKELNIYTYCKNAPIQNSDIMGLNTLIISGGIDTRSYTLLDKAFVKITNIDSTQHDLTWYNFIIAAKLLMQEIRNKNNNETIEWLVNKHTYEVRSMHERILSYPYIPHEVYINIIKEIAQRFGVFLKWYDNEQEFVQGLSRDENGNTRKGNKKICRLDYFGHGYIGKLAIIPNFTNANAGTYITADVFLKEYIAENGIINLETCHSASVYANSKDISIAESIHNKTGARVKGYDGRVSYVPLAAKTPSPPVKGNSIDPRAKLKPGSNPNDYVVDIIYF